MQLFWYTMQLLPNYTALICVCFAEVYIVHFVLIKHRDFFSLILSLCCDFSIFKLFCVIQILRNTKRNSKVQNKNKNMYIV